MRKDISKEIIDQINQEALDKLSERFTDLMIYGVSITDSEGNRIDPVDFFNYLEKNNDPHNNIPE